jgi:hypothetical protein
MAGAMPLLQRVLDSGDGELQDRVRSALKLPQTFKKRGETPRSQLSSEAKAIAERSLQAGYLKDALKYLTIAHENDPVDFQLMLKLGWTHNILKQDREAVQWFNQARRSPDPQVSEEAGRAYGNLAPAFARFRTTAWLFPFFSSRWNSVFSYGQVKTEIRIGGLPVRPYTSVRFVGDTRGATLGAAGGVTPQYLSESAFIVGFGLATPVWRGLMAWAEAGEAISYLGRRADAGLMVPDYRGGLAFGRGWGKLMGAESGGLFVETNDDLVYVSRFQNDVLVYSQNRTGVTLAQGRLQLYWNHNLTVDAKRQYWANFVETGPGLRFRAPGFPPGLVFHVNLLRGAHLVNEGNPRRPNFTDLRAGFWYAASR